MPMFVPKRKSKQYVYDMNYININPFNRASRVPNIGGELRPYRIIPSVSALENYIKESLDRLLADGAVDGQNGNVLDKVIEDWAELAKKYLECQKEENIGRIEMLSNVRIANRDNAEKCIFYEEEELQRLRKKIEELSKKIAKEE